MSISGTWSRSMETSVEGEEISLSCIELVPATLESLDEARESREGNTGVLFECVTVWGCGCGCLSSEVAEEVEEFRDFDVMLPLQRGQVCLIFSQGSTQFLWNSCLGKQQSK